MACLRLAPCLTVVGHTRGNRAAPIVAAHGAVLDALQEGGEGAGDASELVAGHHAVKKQTDNHSL